MPLALPTIPAPYRHPNGAAYRVIKPLLADGVQLQSGDMLPPDNALRANPRRLETLCRTRHLEAVLSPVTSNVPATIFAKIRGAEPEILSSESADSIDLMSLKELQQQCRMKDLSWRGTKGDLQSRLRLAAMA